MFGSDFKAAACGVCELAAFDFAHGVSEGSLGFLVVVGDDV